MLIPVILSGGAGSRLWPVSREAYPKPFIRLHNGKTLLQQTFERAAGIDGVTAIITVTNAEYYFLTREEYQKSALTPRQIFVLEPCGRNTAPAVAMAALCAVSAYGPEAQLLILPADHVVSDQSAFREAVHAARALARKGALVTFGVVPARPETGYGYIERGTDPVDTLGFRVKRFVEKPTLEVAREFVATGRFLWNSGMFCFGAQVYLDALAECAPDMFGQVTSCWALSAKTDTEKINLDATEFANLEDISIDYAVMEKHGNVAVVEARFDWNDIGSWSAVGDLTAPDADGNRVSGEAIMVETRDCYIQSDSRVVAAVGVKDLIIVDTPDALLVVDKHRAQDVKRVVSHLKLNNHATHQVHRTVHRPWGTYTVLEEGPYHKVKRISVKPRASLSLQMHHHRSEHWVVLSGIAEVVNGTQTYTINPSESTFIPAGHQHRLTNTGDDELVIVEVQTGSYVGEDDIVRFQDVYGRA